MTEKKTKILLLITVDLQLELHEHNNLCDYLRLKGKSKKQLK